MKCSLNLLAGNSVVLCDLVSYKCDVWQTQICFILGPGRHKMC